MTYYKRRLSITKIYKGQTEISTAVYKDGNRIEFGAAGGGAEWGPTFWTGSVDSVSQTGGAVITTGNASQVAVVEITLDGQPAGFNFNSGSRTVQVTVTVYAPVGGSYTNNSFTRVYSVQQDGYGAGTPSYSAWTDSGDPYNGTTDTVYGAWSEWAPASAGQALETVDQTRSRTVTLVTSGRRQDQTRVCQLDGATADVGLCGGTAADLSRTLIGAPDVPNLEVAQTPETESRTIDNPNYLEPWTQAEVVDFLESVISIGSNGVVNGTGTRQSKFEDPDTQTSISFFVALAPDSDQTDPAWIDSSDKFPAILFGSSSQTRTIHLTVTGNIPNGFQNEGDAFSFSIGIQRTQLAESEAPAMISGVNVRWEDNNGDSQAQNVTTDGSDLFITPQADYTIQISYTPSYATFSFSPEGTEAIQPATHRFPGVGGIGRVHDLTATTASGSDTFRINIIGSFAGGFQ